MADVSNKNNTIDKLVNRIGTAEGSLVPPLQVGATRVPPVTQLQLIKTSNAPAGTNFTLQWQDVANLQGNKIDHYNVYAVDPNNNQVFTVNNVSLSPCIINVFQPVGKVIKFIVQTVLSSGLSTPLSLCPSISGKCINGSVSFT